MSYTLRSNNRDGTKNATEITAEQALDLSDVVDLVRGVTA